MVIACSTSTNSALAPTTALSHSPAPPLPMGAAGTSFGPQGVHFIGIGGSEPPQDPSNTAAPSAAPSDEPLLVDPDPVREQAELTFLGTSSYPEPDCRVERSRVGSLSRRSPPHCSLAAPARGCPPAITRAAPKREALVGLGLGAMSSGAKGGGGGRGAVRGGGRGAGARRRRRTLILTVEAQL